MESDREQKTDRQEGERDREVSGAVNLEFFGIVPDGSLSPSISQRHDTDFRRLT